MDQTLLSKAMAKKAQFVATIAAHQTALSSKPSLPATPPASDASLSVNFRTRPLSTAETKAGVFRVLFCDNGQTTLYYPSFRILTDTAVDVQEFAFDGNFGPEAENEDVYREAVLPKLRRAMDENGILTVMAYGQTGSGKTYTMFSIAEQLVNDLPLDEEDDSLQAIITIIEIQGDNLRDLSVPPTQKIVPTCKVLLDAQGLPVFMGVQELVATSKQEVLDCFHKGFDMRSTKSTLKNHQSSRSHFVCTIRIVGTARDSNEKVDFQIKLVDLAGSEAGSDKKEHDAETIKESIAINKSLMSLKECIRKTSSANGSATDTTHIPFRTRSTQTTIFALAAPTIADIAHTFNTYRYALALKSLAADSTKDASILDHKSAAAPAAEAPNSPTKTTPMAGADSNSNDGSKSNSRTKSHCDPKHYGRPATEFVLPPWKFLYSMPKEEWIGNADKYAKFKEAGLVEEVRERYKKLVGGKGTVLMVVEDVPGNSENITGGGLVGVGKAGSTKTTGEKKPTRAEIAMAKAKAKGAALRVAKENESKASSFRF
ncbi:P-loop containing nucleoside triphosphate hydrolase protein [Rhizoclosmatium globosum]|uniref:p-loop containing nucleoside triphosphate hydrolase protein n=1 Tax=Rhizoclosmatium globosum TaxID=329046 RepID=A0A1Y2C3K9_9FUNG|nr:P-loop containing nucleoside triphosphate hydrolase protein [Rhizoclosmatium globosum]|eukprot:ORY41608.1 P-loop containing nucleoside triphosphate hydrolase protein [Rhizoclosmatium globosum]